MSKTLRNPFANRVLVPAPTFTVSKDGVAELKHVSCKYCQLASSKLMTFDTFKTMVTPTQIKALCFPINNNYVMHMLRHSLTAIGYTTDKQLKAIIVGQVHGDSAYIDIICSSGCGACITNHFIELVRHGHNVKKVYINEPIDLEKFCTYVNWGFDKVHSDDHGEKPVIRMEYTGNLHKYTMATLPDKYKDFTIEHGLSKHARGAAQSCSKSKKVCKR